MYFPVFFKKNVVFPGCFFFFFVFPVVFRKWDTGKYNFSTPGSTTQPREVQQLYFPVFFQKKWCCTSRCLQKASCISHVFFWFCCTSRCLRGKNIGIYESNAQAVLSTVFPCAQPLHSGDVWPTKSYCHHLWCMTSTNDERCSCSSLHLISDIAFSLVLVLTSLLAMCYVRSSAMCALAIAAICFIICGACCLVLVLAGLLAESWGC